MTSQGSLWRGRLPHATWAALCVVILPVLVMASSLSSSDPTSEPSDARAGEETEIGAVQYWYLEGRGWVRVVEGDGDLRRALVWTGDDDMWVRVARPESEEDVARLEGYRRAVRDRIVWMTCLDPRDPGGGRPEDQMQRLQELTGELFTTAAAWLAWWRANAEQLQLTSDGRGLVAVPQVHNGTISTPTGPAEQRSAILSLRVLRESADTVLVALEYVYAGDHGSEASIGAITLLDGFSLGHWAYRPAPVFPGHHTAHVTLTLNDQAPPGHFTNQMEATIYAPKAGTAARAVFPFEKEWLKEADRARGG